MENISPGPLRRGDGINGEMALEEYLYCTNPYMSSTIPNPFPWPVEAKSIPETQEQQYRPYYQQIEQILSDNGFPSIHDLVGEEWWHYSAKGIIQPVQISKPGYPGGETPVTVFVVSFSEGGLPEQMGPARDQIRDLLWMHGLCVHVEIWVKELVILGSSFFPFPLTTTL